MNTLSNIILIVGVVGIAAFFALNIVMVGAMFYGTMYSPDWPPEVPSETLPHTPGSF